jgi:transposase
MQFKKGISLNKIAINTGVSKSSVFRILRKKKIHISKSKNGQKQKLSMRLKTLILNNFKKIFLITSDAVKYIKNFNILISNQSIRNLLKLNGFGSYKKIKKPYLSEKNIKERKGFGLKYKNFDFFDWKKVIFSDESKFNLHGSDGNHRVWFFKNKRLKKENVQGCKKFGEGNLMVWGCITSEGVGKIICVSNKINSDQYCNTLCEGLI